MSECLGCNRCEDGPMVELPSGVKVCTECPVLKQRKTIHYAPKDKRKESGIETVRDRLKKV